MSLADRISALHRRVPSELDARAWADVLTAEYAIPGSGSRLRPWQGYALAEVAEVGGGFLCPPVGAGKTLLMHLLPQILGARRTVIVMPAALKEKTWADFASYRGRWRTPETPPSILGREELAREGNAKMLERYAPDLIILDVGRAHGLLVVPSRWLYLETGSSRRAYPCDVEARRAAVVAELAGLLAELRGVLS